MLTTPKTCSISQGDKSFSSQFPTTLNNTRSQRFVRFFLFVFIEGNGLIVGDSLIDCLTVVKTFVFVVVL